MFTVAAQAQFHDPGTLGWIIITFCVAAIILGVVWEADTAVKKTESKAISVGLRISRARAEGCPNLDYIEKIYAIGGDQTYTDQLLRAEGY